MNTFKLLTQYAYSFTALYLRIYLAKVFFFSGLEKFSHWDSTIMLFRTTYQVPFMSPLHAAFLGTTFEFILPVLLLVGLAGRMPTFLFMVYNATCIVAYPFLLTAAGYNGLVQHVTWGLMLLALFSFGTGKFSVDYMLQHSSRIWGEFMHTCHRLAELIHYKT